MQTPISSIFDNRSNELRCPKCNAKTPSLIKNGLANGHQRYKCTLCKGTFSNASIAQLLNNLESSPSSHVQSSTPYKRPRSVTESNDSTMQNFNHSNILLESRIDSRINELESIVEKNLQISQNHLSDLVEKSIDSRMTALSDIIKKQECIIEQQAKEMENLNVQLSKTKDFNAATEEKLSKITLMLEHLIEKPAPLKEKAMIENVDSNTPKDKDNHNDDEFSLILNQHDPSTHEHVRTFLKEVIQHKNFFKYDIEPITQDDESGQPKLIYIQGFPFQTLRNLKNHLFKLRFRLTRILHIRFIGKSIVEFLIANDYIRNFRQKIRSFGVYLEILENFNLSKPGFTSISTQEAQERYAIGLAKAMKNTSRREVAQFFENLLMQQPANMIKLARKQTMTDNIEEVVEDETAGQLTPGDIRRSKENNHRTEKIKLKIINAIERNSTFAEIKIELDEALYLECLEYEISQIFDEKQDPVIAINTFSQIFKSMLDEFNVAKTTIESFGKCSWTPPAQNYLEQIRDELFGDNIDQIQLLQLMRDKFNTRTLSKDIYHIINARQNPINVQ